jgi:hypothetical protein
MQRSHPRGTRSSSCTRTVHGHWPTTCHDTNACAGNGACSSCSCRNVGTQQLQQAWQLAANALQHPKQLLLSLHVRGQRLQCCSAYTGHA